MKEKERGKNETDYIPKEKKKGVKKKKSSKAGIEPATSHHYHIATASGIDCTY